MKELKVGEELIDPEGIEISQEDQLNLDIWVLSKTE